MNRRIAIEVLLFLTVCLTIALAILGYAIGNVDTRPYYEPEIIKQAQAIEPDPEQPCHLEVIICDNEPKIIYAKVTQYTKIETCPNHQCRTANGQIPTKDEVAACPRYIAFGTRVRIGTREYTCADRTARRFDGRFDVYHGATEADYQEALAWGVQELEVTILN